MLHARYINGNLAYWDTHQCRIIDAVGATVVKKIEHFVSIPRDDTTRNPLEYQWFSDTATDSCALLTGVTGGVLQLATGVGDNNTTALQLGSIAGTVNTPFVIAGAAGVANSKPLYFGIRVKAVEVAEIAIFVGLAEPNLAADNTLADNSGVPADKDFVGFRTKTDAPTEWDIAWRKAGGAEVEIANVATNGGDWHTFEFFYDGATTVTFWVDGTANATTATTTVATFPGAEKLTPLFYVKTGEGVAKNLQIDWYRVFLFD